mmetsp:Transcript_13670/g.27319  ORF Transcript_13670/g.27319 Transcript_13670/m.27319 type:complete len:178 (+) Transcript_13670:65-598(+)|eukprot:CAMPEP_0181320554 /NCGR_PEP_ID=MMETSP1101-20121128/18190_1 /TAXON_ID=46948 /ORGANISM="Rhodomonas abbreviata, Strain Caron Lab Isolate" /LENGTH=177 /DNA_ID=CAMNT_0023428275 /DNA_START=59 /DNA_END=592 /DNA_ORIENTATION=-
MTEKSTSEQVKKDDPHGLLNAREGMMTLTPQLWFDGDAEKAIQFYEKALGAKRNCQIYKGEDGRVMHCMLLIGDVQIMIADTGSEWTDGWECAPQKGATTSFWVYTKDVDALYKHVIACGMTSRQEPKDMFWGDRMAKVKDPYGHCWDFASKVKKDDTEEGGPEAKKQKVEDKGEAL